MHHLALICLLALFSYLDLAVVSKISKALNPNQHLGNLIQQAEQGDLKAQVKLAKIYTGTLTYYSENPQTGKNFPIDINPDLFKAFKYYKMAAEQNDTESSYIVGNMMLYGDGTPQNFPEAVSWFQKAADKGNTQAMHDLGFCYDKGYGIEKSPQNALKWYTQAANKDFKKSQFNLAKMYYAGIGSKKDLEEAAIWSIMGGHTQIYNRLKNEMGYEDLEKAKSKAWQRLRAIRLEKLKKRKPLK